MLNDVTPQTCGKVISVTNPPKPMKCGTSACLVCYPPATSEQTPLWIKTALEKTTIFNIMGHRTFAELIVGCPGCSMIFYIRPPLEDGIMCPYCGQDDETEPDSGQ